MRLKRLLDSSELVPRGRTRLQPLAHDQFNLIWCQIQEYWVSANRPTVFVNFTGGNKLMALAAYQWARERAMKAFYLERGFNITWFDFDQQHTQSRMEALDVHRTDSLDPLLLVRCHAHASEVERDGQVIKLNSRGRQLPDQDFWSRLPSMTADQVGSLLEVEGHANPKPQTGDALELIVAAALLRLGVFQARRSVRLKVHSAPGVGSRLPHAEIDLLFNFAGRLWIVDCKDRRPVTDLAERLKRISAPSSSSCREEFEELHERLREELSISETKVIKEDLLAVREIGGLLGETICVRRSELSPEVKEFARRHGVYLIENCRRSDVLRASLHAILHPTAPPSAGALSSLEAQYRKLA